MKKVVCPSCKSSHIKLFEVSEAYEYCIQHKDGSIELGPDEVTIQDIIRVEAVCLEPECDKTWTLLGVKNITELPNWPKEKQHAEGNN